MKACLSKTIPPRTSLKHGYNSISTYSRNAATSTASTNIVILPLNDSGATAIGAHGVENKGAGRITVLEVFAWLLLEKGF